MTEQPFWLSDSEKEAKALAAALEREGFPARAQRNLEADWVVWAAYTAPHWKRARLVRAGFLAGLAAQR